MQPELLVFVQLEQRPRVFLVVGNSRDKARLFDDLSNRDDLPAEIVEAVGRALHALQMSVAPFEPGDVA
jgi:hypothetical protein